jgi:hypothetical protein
MPNCRAVNRTKDQRQGNLDMNVATAALVFNALICAGIVLPEVGYAETSTT